MARSTKSHNPARDEVTADNQLETASGDKPEGYWQLNLNCPALTLYKDEKVDGNDIQVESNPQNF